MTDIKSYWDSRYLKEKDLWGNVPSRAAELVWDYIKNNELKPRTLIDVACGYGRDPVFFADRGLSVKACDISDVAIKMAKEHLNSKIDFFVSDLRKLSKTEGTFDIVFGNFILHLFSKEDRVKVLAECLQMLSPTGILSVSVAAKEDADYGVGTQLEADTFVNSRGVVKHYYSEQDIQAEFQGYKIMDIISLEEQHEHGFVHLHKSYLIIAKRK